MADHVSKPRWRLTRLQRDRARSLRRDMTDAERALWQHLRYGRFHGLRFRRQAPVGPFIVDFLCVGMRLVIELDGGQHAGSEGLATDRRRDAYLRANGYSVLRFWNNDVVANIDGVLQAVAAALPDRRQEQMQ